MATTLMGISHTEKTLSIPLVRESGAEEAQHVHLAWPEFEDPACSAALEALNAELRNHSDSVCQHFLQQEDPATDGQLTGSYEIAFLSCAFVSLRLDYHYDFLAARDAERFETACFNINLKTGSPLSFSNCFEAKSEPEKWVMFVESMGQDIDAEHPYPEKFLFNAEGVEFFFPKAGGEASFSWEEVEAHFHVRGLPVTAS